MQAGQARPEGLRDPLGVKTWPLALGRDGERSPMQWSSAPPRASRQPSPGSRRSRLSGTQRRGPRGG
jgi:glycosidase